MIECGSCGEKTANKKYCSRSCAVRVNNAIAPKRKKAEIIKSCAFDQCDSIANGSGVFCVVHRYGRSRKFFTVGEYREHGGYQWTSPLRNMARIWAKENLDTSCCWVCGYSLHVNCCHIEDLAGMPDDALAEDTCVDNIVILCKNHHWEFDHGYLTLEEILEVSGGFRRRLPDVGAAPGANGAEVLDV